MKMWMQIKGHDEDDECSDDATYEILTGGVLKVLSGNDIHPYSPAHWQETRLIRAPRFSVTKSPTAGRRPQMAITAACATVGAKNTN